jgi:Domain of unknown function (DUF4157)
MRHAVRERNDSSGAAPKAKSTPKAAPASLRIGEADDSFEQEAERRANDVIAGGSATRDWSLSRMSVNAPESMPDESAASETLNPTPAGAAGGSVVPAIVHEVLDSPGRPLDASTREFFEPRFGYDLSGVRVHTGEQAAESARAVQARAYAVGHDVVLDSGHAAGADRRVLAHELVHTLQQERGGAMALQRQPPPPSAPPPEMKLVDDFAAKFPAAANLIKPNPAAMKLIKEAFDAGAIFGGFAEDGPDKAEGRAYTVGHTVYVPKTRANPPVEAMRDFLFELNNAIRQPKFAAVQAAAAAGAKSDTAAARKYAHDTAEGEVEGMLRLGEVWFETKAKYLGKKAHDFDAYDAEFFLSEYQSFKDRKKTKEDIVNDVLQRKYDTGTLKGKTVEQHYMEQYQSLAK